MIKLDFKKKLQGSNGVINLEISETVENKTFLAIFGKSGVGKSTILNILAGILKPDSGEIIVDKEIWFSSKKGINLPPQKRDIGYLFQDYALFPNMSVEENINFALKKSSKSSVEQILNIMDLVNLKDKKPHLLSGGQKQRVALARAIIKKPKLLLLDEPLSALDLEMRKRLQNELLKIHHQFGITTFLVSHDISEVYQLATDILKIKNGKVVKRSSPSEMFGGKNLHNSLKFSGEIIKVLEASCLVLVGHDIIEVEFTNSQNIQIGTTIIISVNQGFKISSLI